MLRNLTTVAFDGARDVETQRQPVGFDLTVQSVSRFARQGALGFDNDVRELPELRELEWVGDAPLLLHPGGYLVNYNEVVDVPLDSAGLVLPRSSLLRCGSTLHTALWEPGYRGRGYGLLTAHHPIALYRHARIAQLIMLNLEQAVELGYTGVYQGENTA
ncbi:MAG: deoxyuridine 5'-triphosphate nucleotidohydrolase [bacterium]|nr:deoxyuridine 5'-triphosphate nucleotidohydrolase [bacterium]